MGEESLPPRPLPRCTAARREERRVEPSTAGACNRNQQAPRHRAAAASNTRAEVTNFTIVTTEASLPTSKL